MSKKQLRKHSPEFKAKVALESIRGELTMNQISTKYSVHSTQINRWKNQAMKTLKSAFTGKQLQAGVDQQSTIDGLYRRIGELTCENEFLKKSVWD